MGLDDLVKRYVITSAQRGAEPNHQFLESIDTYARRNNAEVIILPLRGCYKDDVKLSPRLQQYTVVDDRDRKLNDNIQISDWEVPPTAVDPLAGIKRFAHGQSSFIFGSPKQRLEYIAVPNGRIPKAVMSTGAVTEPFYKTHTAVGKKAEHDHEYGAVIVDVVNDEFFHFRFIKANKAGGFSDITGEYNGKKYKTKPQVEALIVGDLHPYDTDPAHERNTLSQLRLLRPRNVFLHDAFNGKSISHHYQGHNIEKHRVAEEQGLDLGAELAVTARAITKYAEATSGTVYIVKSNHDEHLERYLDEGRFIGDKGNDLVAAQLYVEALRGRNVLERGFSMYGGVPNNVTFLSRDDSVKLAGYELANHGDLGANGARPSLNAIELANGKSITGHRHSPAKLRDTYVVGTSTYLRLSYNRGYSSWVQANAVLYKDGGVQILNTINGRWKI